MLHSIVDPIAQARTWIDEERERGVPFAHGAVLATQGLDGVPRSRMLGAYLTPDGRFTFYTSPTSRKVREIERSPLASLTFGFQGSLRSITVEGSLAPLTSSELDEAWKGLDLDFKRQYMVFGPKSAAAIASLDSLRQELRALPAGIEATRPESFIGYAFQAVTRIVFYAVDRTDFARCEEFQPTEAGGWSLQLRVP